MVTEYISPFDFRKVLVDNFLGSSELFVGAFIIVLSFVCAKYQMSNRIYSILLAISAIIFSFMLGEAIYIIIILIVGFITFKSLSKILA